MADPNAYDQFMQDLINAGLYNPYSYAETTYPLVTQQLLSAGQAMAEVDYAETFYGSFPNAQQAATATATATTTPQNERTGSPSTSVGAGQGAKNRLHRACDSCSVRKVKCDEEGPPCRACRSLEIPCTFDRPARRRGPPNRVAEAIKKRKLASDGGRSDPSPSVSPTTAARALASMAIQETLSAESICPLSLLYPLVDDYFLYIHPLIPIPHERTFREALNRRDDLHDSTFLSLLAGMIGILVVSFPRKPREHLKAQHKEDMFPRAFDLVERCRKVAVDARGAGFLDKEHTVYDAATSLLLGTTSAYSFNWAKCKLYLAESMQIMRSLGFHKAAPANMDPEYSPGTAAKGKTKLDVDFITQEMSRRLFWTLFVGVKSLHQLGASFTELFIPPATPSEPYPPLPLEVDDAFIFKFRIIAQPVGFISELVGFNANVRIFSSYNALTTMELAYGVGNCYDWDRQKVVFEQCLHACKNALAGVPEELVLKPKNWTQSLASGVVRPENYPPLEYPDLFTDVQDFTGDPLPSEAMNLQRQRRQIQYEIQKANIYISQLSSRSYIVEKYWTLYEGYRLQSPDQLSGSGGVQGVPWSVADMSSSQTAQYQGGTGVSGSNLTYHSNPFPGESAPGMVRPESAPFGPRGFTEEGMAAEREEIVRELLVVLQTISQVNMEPNGASLINKIRKIASTLLDVPRTRKGDLARRAEQYLAAFLKVLMKLERVPLGRMQERQGSGGSNSSISGAGSGTLTGNTSAAAAGGAGDVEGLGGGGEGGAVEDDEEAELMHWADLREYQHRLAQTRGLFEEL